MPLEPDRLQRLIELGRSLVSELDLEAVLQRVLEVARELTGARYAALGILDDDRRELQRFLTSGVDEATHRAIGDLPRGRGVLGVLTSDPKPLRLSHVGEHPRSYGFPPGHPRMDSFLGVPVLVRGEPFGNLYLTEKTAGDFTAEDEEALIVLADWAAIAIDNARVHRAVSRQRDELERAVRGFEATTELARAIGGQIELPLVVDLVAKRARALVDARLAAVLVLDSTDLIVQAAAGEGRDAVLGVRAPLDRSSLLREILRTGAASVVELDQRTDAPIARAAGATAGLYVPMHFQGEPLGAVVTFDPLAGGHFRPEDERALGAFAASAASAVATAQHAARRGLRLSIEAAERERRHWARELHDETLQHLGGLRMLLSSARRRGTQDALSAAVDDAVELLSDGIKELRALITDLRPASLDELGAKAALEALVDRVRRLSDIAIDLEVDLDWESGRAATRHEPQLEAAIYRITQEALNNVTRHSGATRADVQVVERHQRVDIVVTDDGQGFEAERTRRGFGLIGMQERAALVGGHVDVRSTPGEGTTVHARLPAMHRAP